MLRAATHAVRVELAEWGLDSPAVCERVADVALKAALGRNLLHKGK
jgi:hypothetical protein